VYLTALFGEFCKYVDGKLKWSETKPKEWTELIWKFFDEQKAKEATPFIREEGFMLIDHIWRYPANYSIDDIELAVEHEGLERNIDVLVKEEIRHLIDLKARNKIGIFYPRRAEEKDFLGKISESIKRQSESFRIDENYLIILGYPDRKSIEGVVKPVILIRGFFFDEFGEEIDEREQVVLQSETIG
jgi:hypothetical protein